MKRISSIVLLFAFINSLAQDEKTIISTPKKEEPLPAKIFYSERTTVLNTNEIVAKGYMSFKVAHNFDDIAGTRGGPKSFFGLDNSTDVRIGFDFGLSDRLNLVAARAKGGGEPFGKIRVSQLYELGLKYQLARQLENDPSHPIAITVYLNNVISAMNSNFAAPSKPPPFQNQSNDTSLNQANTFHNWGDRSSQLIQAIFARKAGKISLLANLSFVHRGYVPLHDDQSMFAIGGTIKLPLTKSINLLLDYIHPFRSAESKDYFSKLDTTFYPALGNIDFNRVPFKFYDPLGIGFEFITEGHVFHLNFTNATDILDNRLITSTASNWGKGQFRWAFSIARKFALKKSKYYE